MKRDWKHYLILASIILAGVLMGLILYNHVNWDYICTHPVYHYLKPYFGTCTIKGYPLFP